MTGPDPQREPQSETEEKPEILKSHEEFIDNGTPSMTRQEYQQKKEAERRNAGEGPNRNQPPPGSGDPAAE